MENLKLKNSYFKRFKVKSSLVRLLGIVKIKVTGLQRKQRTIITAVKPKPKSSQLTNHNRCKYHSEPIRAAVKTLQLTESAGKFALIWLRKQCLSSNWPDRRKPSCRQLGPFNHTQKLAKQNKGQKDCF